MKPIYYLLAFFLMIVSCESGTKKLKDTVFQDKKVIIGHRGARGLLPENTIPGFIKGIELGVDAIECDVFISHDDQIIISHGPTISSVFASNPDGSPVTKAQSDSLIIHKMNYDEILKYDVGKRVNPDFPRQKSIPQKIPLLTHMFDSVKRYYKEHPEIQKEVVFILEIRSWHTWDNVYTPPYNQYIDSVMFTVKRYYGPERIILHTYDTRALKYLRRNYPEYTTEYLRRWPDAMRNLDSLRFSPKVYGPLFHQATKPDIDTLHKLGIKVFTWTPDTLDQMIYQLDSLNVDGIGTDYPDIAVSKWGNPNHNLNAKTLEFEPINR
ncbi:MAG: glycerophosphodiester phosphodiesterase family protein [Hyphomicrobiales bacterium]